MNAPDDSLAKPFLHSASSSADNLVGKLLLASPSMKDPRFHQTVILLCQHSAQGTMGIILNKPLNNMRLQELVQQFNLQADLKTGAEQVYFGGPVETVRGFVLHTDEYDSSETQSILPCIKLTATLDVVRKIVQNDGPRKSLMALGYAGWGPDQLDQELREHSWNIAEASETMMYDLPNDERWMHGYASIGLDPYRLNDTSGRA